MSTPPPTNRAEAFERRAREVIESALADEEFLNQLRESLAAADRGERGAPLGQLQAQERQECHR